ncbi:MAG: S8 family serine peptidase [Alphaproteobacteria bacterium]|jgi:subtilisin family serine protease|nr:S8 family serine peptidase [Alphaproteobacteria bacterium]
MKLANWNLFPIALIAFLAGGAAQAQKQAQVLDLNQIIRGLAPLEYLSEHSGKPPRASVDLDIRFDIGRATLAPQARAQLRELGRALQSEKLRDKRIEIAGHTDATGPAAQNKALSLRRAGAVAGYLQREFAIDPGRLVLRGHGEERLKDPARPAHGVNRRVEISVTGTAKAAKQHRAMATKAPRKGTWTNINDLVRFDYTPAMAMTVDAVRLNTLLEGKAVAQVYEDRLLPPRLQRSVPLIGLDLPRAPTRTGAGTAVAIIDSGVDGEHPFLRDKVVAEACFSSEVQVGGMNARSACPNGARQEIGPDAGRPCDPAYGCDHGTHVAGIVAGGNSEMTGVALQAAIVAVQVSSLVEAPMCGRCAVPFTSDILRGLEWVYRNREQYGIAAVNLSLGSGRYHGVCDSNSPFTRIFALLSRAGVAPVVAAGNDGFADALSSPACVSHAISVGATSYRDNVAAFSNSAGFLDFLAPGATEQAVGSDKGILSAVPGREFRRFQGTSMAAPHVAGAFAILKAAVPNASLAQMRDALRQTGRMVADPRNGITLPRIQLDRAITALQGAVGRVRAEQPPGTGQGSPPEAKEKVHDGIRVQDDRGESQKEGEKRIKW